MSNWDWKTCNGIEYVSVASWLSNGVDIAFSSRLGGCSTGPYESLNMGLHVEDNPLHVIENRRRYLSIFNLQLEDSICCEQVHGNHVMVVDEKDRSKGIISYDTAIKSCDGLITNVPGLNLLAFFADCYPLYFYDPDHRAIGLSHAGWKGTMGQIGKKTIEAMASEYGTLASSLLVFIGPGIADCCFRIDADLANKVSEEFSDLHDIIFNKGPSHNWNLQETNKQLMMKQGVCEENIICCPLCTCCENKFFSYRREHGRTGRMAALIALEY